ncbi:hypothetical protein PMAYCL1PPCAC_20464, partial [Pristionchus mayeri]
TFNWHNSSVFHSCSSENSEKGSRLKRREPENSTGSCGIIASFLLNSCNPTREVTTPSIIIDPSAASTIRKRASVREDLPDPVLPTTATFSPALI